MKNAKAFLKAIMIVVLAGTFFLTSCAEQKKQEEAEQKVENEQKEEGPFFQLSLAQWSLHKQIQGGELDAVDFAQKANELGFEGIEYVSQLYNDHLAKGDDPAAAMEALLKVLKEKSETCSLLSNKVPSI